MSSSATATVCTGPTHHATASSGGVEDGDDDEARSEESKMRLGGVEGAPATFVSVMGVELDSCLSSTGAPMADGEEGHGFIKPQKPHLLPKIMGNG
ncbi:unnamed protein product [Miscanthus lutarioriparius]|uniref:Uncharacterized protein n=1 Tax=Miscanthus lutarioriparius TaxID=422564 RepID=A0A811MWF5_9POAL|nr:unnamed protein product [Miscanthus lutarioriparius]